MEKRKVSKWVLALFISLLIAFVSISTAGVWANLTSLQRQQRETNDKQIDSATLLKDIKEHLAKL